MFGKSHSVAITGFALTVVLSSTAIVNNGCGVNTGGSGISCGTDADPNDWPECYDDAGPKLDPEACTGQCIPKSPSGFHVTPALVWMGPEEDEPQCPERAASKYFAGYEGLTVALPCQQCACEPTECILPTGMVANSGNACQGGNATNYDSPADWDGSCISPAQLPAGSFRSIELTPATVSSCKPMGNAEPKAPSFAPTKSSFAGGVYWKNRVKSCEGFADGKCPTTDLNCVPNTQPAPPEFRQCYQYDKPIDENNLPQCPNEYPERFTFYEDKTGKVECSPCECGEPVGAQCSVSFSAYQDTTCSGAPMPLFENVPAINSQCIDFGAMSVSLDSMSAKWAVNEPGQCEPKGGELVGEVKPIAPHVFCCQPLEPSKKAPKE